MTKKYIEKNEIKMETSYHEKLSSTFYNPIIKSEIEKRLIKKLNWTLLPLTWAIVFIQSSDKSSLATGAVMNMMTDVDISPSQYSLLGSIFYVGFIAFQIPNSYLIQRLPISKYLGSLIVLWGISVLGMAFCKSYGQLLACRVLLGLFEAPTYPCLFIIFNSLYRRQEQSACLGFLWMCNGLGAIFSAIVVVAIIKTLDGVHGIGLWRWNFMIHGMITIVIGIVTFFFLIDDPHSKLLRLTEDEKKIVEERIQDNAVVKDKTIKVHYYWEALYEPRFYLIAFATFANFLSIGGLVVFSTLFIKSLGFNALESILLNIPTSMMSVLFTFMAIYLYRKTKKFSIAITVCGLIAMIGCILLTVLPHTSVKLLGFYLTWANSGSYVFILTIVSSNVSGYSKKVIYNAAIMIGYTLGNFVGPFVMLANEAPIYRSGMIVFIVGNLMVIVSILFSLYLMHLVNKKRLAVGVTKTDAYLDLTDREDGNFIYKL